MSLLKKILIGIASVFLYILTADSNLELLFAFGLILIMGIPHGSTDHLLSRYTNIDKLQKLPMWKFIAVYLTVMLLYGLLWYLQKEIAFILFLGISAFHFGEAQLISYQKKLKFHNIAYLLWGAAVLIILFIFHLEQAAHLIVPYLVSEAAFTFFQINAWYILGALMAPLLIILLLNSHKLLIKEVLELSLLMLISYFTSLLFGFAIFFAFWHSFDSTSHQLESLKKIKTDFNFSQWMKEAAPFTVISWIGLMLLTVLFIYMELSWPVTTLFFVLVSLITLPHIIVMSGFYKGVKH